LADRELDEHHPAERHDRRVRAQHTLALDILDDLDGVLLRTGWSAARMLHLREPRQIRVAQNETNIRMRDQPPISADDIRIAALPHLDLRNHIPDEFEIDLGDADTRFLACAAKSECHVRLRLAAEIDRSVINFAGLRLNEGWLFRAIGI